MSAYIDLKTLSEPWCPSSYIGENHNWLYRFRYFKGVPVIQTGDSLFIGTLENIKNGTYKVIGTNDFGNGKLLYYLAHFNLHRLERIDLSNGHIINNIKGRHNNNLHMTNWNYINSKAAIMEYSKGKSMRWKLDMPHMGT